MQESNWTLQKILTVQENICLITIKMGQNILTNYFAKIKNIIIPSDILLILSKAATADLKGAKDANFTIWLNFFKSVTEASTCGRSMPTSSNSLTLNKL